MSLGKLGYEILNLDLNKSIQDRFSCSSGDNVRGLIINLKNNGIAVNSTGINIKAIFRDVERTTYLDATLADALIGQYDLEFPLLVPGIVFVELYVSEGSAQLVSKRFIIDTTDTLVDIAVIENTSAKSLTEKLIVLEDLEIDLTEQKASLLALEGDLVAAESSRQLSDKARSDLDIVYAQAEKAREDKALGQASAADQHAAAEAARVTAEDERKDSESSRKTAESNRQVWEQYDLYKPYNQGNKVYQNGSSYVAKKYVPAGTPVTNTEFWQIIALGSYPISVDEWQQLKDDGALDPNVLYCVIG